MIMIRELELANYDPPQLDVHHVRRKVVVGLSILLELQNHRPSFHCSQISSSFPFNKSKPFNAPGSKHTAHSW
jgi:hypothetical protein